VSTEKTPPSVTSWTPPASGRRNSRWLVSIANETLYTASKFGVNGFMRSLRKEMSDETVRVTVVMPGPVVTELNDCEHWEGRAMDPKDVADAVVFAASRSSRVELTQISVDSTDKL
jgi:NADP-dependent 3-hydroxy acid dehydrogenase YdfG